MGLREELAFGVETTPAGETLAPITRQIHGFRRGPNPAKPSTAERTNWSSTM